MFYVREDTRNKLGSIFSEEGVSCYDIIELPGFLPIYLAEMPVFGEEGELEGRKPLIVNNLDSVISLKDRYEFPLVAVKVWMLFPGFMNKSEGWQVQRITAIWGGTWQYKKDELTCRKLEFANGESVLSLENQPICDAKVEWVQVL